MRDMFYNQYVVICWCKRLSKFWLLSESAHTIWFLENSACFGGERAIDK